MRPSTLLRGRAGFSFPQTRENIDLFETRHPVAPLTSTVTRVPEGRSTAPRRLIQSKEELRTDSCKSEKNQRLC